MLWYVWVTSSPGDYGFNYSPMPYTRWNCVSEINPSGNRLKLFLSSFLEYIFFSRPFLSHVQTVVLRPGQEDNKCCVWHPYIAPLIGIYSSRRRFSLTAYRLSHCSRVPHVGYSLDSDMLQTVLIVLAKERKITQYIILPLEVVPVMSVYIYGDATAHRYYLYIYRGECMMKVNSLRG